MKRLLNTLYVMTPDAYLSRDGQNIVVSAKNTEIGRVPSVNIESIVSFSYIGASPGLMSLCAENGIALSFHAPSGKFIGRLCGPTRGNVLLRRSQYQVSEDAAQSLRIAKLMIAGKIQNCRTVIRRHIRDNGTNEEEDEASKKLRRLKVKALEAKSADTLRGVEGEAASEYFGVFDRLIQQQKEFFTFSERSRRPPRDAVNAMLSFAYSLLANEMTSSLESVGIDPYVGIFHTLRPGRASLSLDMIEEFRAYICDRFVLSLINRRQVSPKDFIVQGGVSVTMTDDARKKFLAAWQSRKKEEITHPYLQEKVQIGILPYAQAMLLARHLRGELDAYPVFIAK